MGDPLIMASINISSCKEYPCKCCFLVGHPLREYLFPHLLLLLLFIVSFFN